MTHSGSSVRVILLPVIKRSYEICVDLADFSKIVQESPDHASYRLVPSEDAGLSYLRLATLIYSKLVVLGKPCLDVAIHRRNYLNLEEARESKSTNSSNNASGSASPVQHIVIPCGVASYAFGDGSPDFNNKYKVVAVGGTFDRLHAGHRLLLTAAAWASRDKLQIGITSDNLLEQKKYKRFIAPLHERSESAKRFAKSVKPTLPSITISELKDPAGPSAVDPRIEAIVVSSETVGGARKINEVRAAAGLKRMVIIEVDVLDTGGQKLSSSALREAESKKQG